MEKKSVSSQKSDPKEARILNPMEPGLGSKPGKQTRVKIIGDPEFDQVIESLIHELGIHS